MKLHGILIAMLVVVMFAVPCAAADSQESFNAAGALYSQSVDLANAGKYQEALDAADKALAMNVTSLSGVIQSNRAGILVMLHRYDEAITSADAALAVEGNLTSVHSIAWYNKGNALRALGRTVEAQVAYDHAFALDNTLVPPDMSGDIVRPTTMPPPTTFFLTMSQPLTTTPSTARTMPLPATTQRSPLPVVTGISAVAIATLVCTRARKPPAR
jgi:tetratricopeptide (TPR) repeat protein